MAMQNFVFLYGQVLKKPRIAKDEDGNYVMGMCTLNVLRGLRDTGDSIKQLKYSCPVIMTRNPELVAIMDTWNEGDMCEVKGTVTTREIKKSTTCPHCREKNKKDGNAVFISPIYMSSRETNVSKEQGLALLKQRCEISNQVILIGALCREPEKIELGNDNIITQYQLSVNRKFKIKEDSVDKKTDYPWVKSYGKYAKEDAETLHTGSVILVDGMLQTRDVERTTHCECGQSYKWNDAALEVVPFAVEYLKNFYSADEIEKNKEMKYQALSSEILGGKM